MGKRITIDPITRIEGHLRIEVEVEGGKVKTPGAPVRCSGELKLYCRGVIPVMRRFLCSDPAESEPTPTICPR